MSSQDIELSLRLSEWKGRAEKAEARVAELQLDNSRLRERLLLRFPDETYRNRAYRWLMSEAEGLTVGHIPNAVESLMALLAEIAAGRAPSGGTP